MQVVVGGARRRVRVAAVTRPWLSVRVVAQEGVVFAIGGILAARAAEYVARREGVERQQHVVDDGISDGGSVCKAQVVRVAQRVPPRVVLVWVVYGRGIVEEGALGGLAGVEGSHGDAGLEGSRGPRRRGRPWLVEGKVVHRRHREGIGGVPLAAVHSSRLEQTPR
jgi:hypothetical protein